MGISSVMLYSAMLRGKLSVLVLHLPKLAELLSERQQVRNGLYKVPKQDLETDCFGLLGLVGLGFLLLQVVFFFFPDEIPYCEKKCEKGKKPQKIAKVYLCHKSI